MAIAQVQIKEATAKSKVAGTLSHISEATER